MIYENVRLLSCHVNVVLIVLILLYGRCIDLCISKKIANFAVANGCRLFGLHCGLRETAVCKRLTDKSKLIKL